MLHLNLNFKQSTSLVVSLYLIITPAYALPTGAQVKNGNVNFKIEQQRMQITASDKAIINYKTFNIGSKEAVIFVQPSSHAVVLNRVLSANPSSILGTLTANGRVFLINPSGILFGKNAQINVNSLIATTLNISDKDFINGNYNFKQLANMPKGYIIQNGNIHISDNGFIVLAAPFIKNSGTIIAHSGQVKIGAVDNFYLNFDGRDLVMFSYKPSSTKSDIILSKEAAQNVIKNVINPVQPQHKLKLVQKDGIIKLVAESGTAIVGGKIDTSAKSNNKAGNVDIVAQQNIELNNLNVTANAGNNGNGGNIYIFSDGDAYGNSNVLLSSKGGLYSGDGGFIEFSAKKTVTMNGMKVDTLASHGKVGTFYVDPEDIIIASNEIYNANPELEATNSIVLTKEHYLISSKNTNISLYAPTITLEDHTRIKSGGDVLLKTTSKDGNTLYKHTSINIGQNVLITGKNVDLEAISSDVEIENQHGDFSVDKGPFANLHFAYKNTNASSSIVMGHSEIKAAGDITIHSESTSNTNLQKKDLGLALVLGKSSASSTINLDSSILVADHDVNIHSKANTINQTKSKVSNRFYDNETQKEVVVKADLAFTYSESTTTAKTTIDQNSLIKAGNDININAVGYKDIATSASAASYSKGVLGSAVSWGVSNSDVNVKIGGKIVAGNNLSIDAYTDVKRMITTSSSGVGNGFIAKQIESFPNLSDLYSKADQAEKGLKESIDSKDSKANAKGSSSGQNALSAAISYSKHKNNNKVEILTKDNLGAKKGNLHIKADIYYEENAQNVQNNPDTKEEDLSSAIFGSYGLKTSAIATIDSTDKNTKDNSASGAVAITDVINNTNVNIDDGVILNSFNGNIDIASSTYIRYNINWDDFIVSDQKTILGVDIPNFLEMGGNLIKGLKEKGEDAASFRTNLFTSFAQSNAQGSKNSLAGSYNNFSLSNSTRTHIGNNVLINQDKANTNYKNVNIYASDTLHTMNFAGVIGWLYFGSKSGGVGVGGAYLKSTDFDSVKADINTGTKINAKALYVKAVKDGNNFGLATAGGSSKYAVSGSYANQSVDDDVYAYLDSVDVNLGNGVINIASNDDDISADKNMVVSAQDHLDVIGGSGGITLGKAVGVGVSVSKNKIDRDTKAYITNDSNINTDIDRELAINAQNTGYIGAYTLSSTAVNPGKSASKNSSPAGAFGLAVSAESGLNYVQDKANAYLYKSHINVDDGNRVEGVVINAYNLTDYIGLSGGASFNRSIVGAVGASGSYTGNYIKNTANAYIYESDLNIGGLSVLAKNSGAAFIYTASLSGGNGLTNIAGSVGISEITNTTNAYIKESNIELLEDQTGLNVHATNDTVVENYAGGVGFSKFLGVGASYASNTVKNKTYAYIDSSIIKNNNHDISIIANESGEVHTNAIGGALAINGLAASASIVNNDIEDDIQSYISADWSVSTINGANTDIKALDNTKLESLAGFLSVSKYLGVGGGFITNNIDNSLYSGIKQSTLTADVLNVSSISNKTISGVVVGGSGGYLAATGSHISNTLSGDVSSSIEASNVTASTILVHAIEQNNFDSNAGGAQISVEGIGTSNNINNISHNISAYVDNSDIIVKGDKGIQNADITGKDYYGLSVLTLANENVGLKSMNGSYGGESAQGNFNSLHIADTLNSYLYVVNVNKNINDADSKQDVLVKSIVNDNVVSKGGAFVLGLAGGMGSSNSNINIQNSTTAKVNLAYIKAQNSLDVVAQEKEEILPEVVSGAVGCANSLAGSVSIINVKNTNNATVLYSNLYSHNTQNILATDTTLLGYQNDEEQSIKVGSIGFSFNIPQSQAPGAGASVDVNHIRNQSIVSITDSNINNNNKLTISSNNTAKIRNNLKAGAISIAYSLSGSILVNNISSKTQTILNNTPINQNSDYMSGSQDVFISATDDNDIKDTLDTGVIGGMVAAGTSVDITTISHQTSLDINARAGSIFAKRDLDMEANSYKTFNTDVKVNGIGGENVSGSSIIANLDNHNLLDEDSTYLQIGDKKVTFVDIVGNIVSKIGDIVDLVNKDKSDSDKSNDNSSEVTYNLFGTGEQNSDLINLEAQKYVNINAGMKLNINTNNKYDLIINAGEKSLGLRTEGAALSLVYLGSNTGITLGEKMRLSGDIINIDSNYIVNSNITEYDGKVGDIGVLGAVYSQVYNKYNNIISLGGDDIISRSDIGINANTVENINITNIGQEGSEIYLLGAIYSGIESTDNATKVALKYTAYNGSIIAGHDLDISSTYSNDLNAYSGAGSASIGMALQGTMSSVKSTPTVGLTIDYKDIYVQNNASIYTSVNNYVNAISIGADYAAGIAVGASIANATFNPTDTLELKTPIHAGNNINIKNYLNTDVSLDKNMINSGVWATAKASAGSLLSGAAGAIATVDFNPDTSINIIDSNQYYENIEAMNNINIRAANYLQGAANSNSHVFSMYVAGATKSSVDVSKAKLYTSIDRTLVAKNNVRVDNYSGVNMNSVSVGGQGGEFGVSGTESQIKASNLNLLGIDTANLISENDSVDVLATNDTHVYSHASDYSDSFVSANAVKSNVIVNNQVTGIYISNSNLQAAHNINIISNQQTEKMISKAESTIAKLKVGGIARAEADLGYLKDSDNKMYYKNLGEADVSLRKVHLKSDTITINAVHNPYDYLKYNHPTLDVETNALAKIGVSVAGLLYSTTIHHVKFKSHLTLNDVSYDSPNYQQLAQTVFSKIIEGKSITGSTTYNIKNSMSNVDIVETDNHSIIGEVAKTVTKVVNWVLDKITDTDKDYIKNTTSTITKIFDTDIENPVDNAANSKSINTIPVNIDESKWNISGFDNGEIINSSYNALIDTYLKRFKNVKTHSNVRKYVAWWKNADIDVGNIAIIPSDVIISALEIPDEYNNGDNGNGDNGLYGGDVQPDEGDGGNAQYNGNNGNNGNDLYGGDVQPDEGDGGNKGANNTNNVIPNINPINVISDIITNGGNNNNLSNINSVSPITAIVSQIEKVIKTIPESVINSASVPAVHTTIPNIVINIPTIPVSTQNVISTNFVNNVVPEVPNINIIPAGNINIAQPATTGAPKVVIPTLNTPKGVTQNSTTGNTKRQKKSKKGNK